MRGIALALTASFVASTSAQLDKDTILEDYYGNDAEWYQDRIPVFETSDKTIQDVYYYRWELYRTHQRNIGDYGFITTEFIDNVPWQTQPWASNNCAAIFHLNEGRWCRDPRYKRDYASFMYSSDSKPRQYTESMADGVWNNYLVDGNPELAVSLLDAMQDNYEGWISSRFDASKGLFWVAPLQDATEYTISSIDASGAIDGFGGGEAFRPTFNSYQVANARAIARIAQLQGGLQDVVDLYTARADDLKERIQTDLWNTTFEHFTDRFYVDNEYVNYWDFIRGRELAGIVPWAHNVPDDAEEFSAAWQHVFNSDRLAGPFGLRTVEPSYEHYMRVWRYQGDQVECHWNGPMWPYQTTQVLTALANVLDHYPTSAAEAGLTVSNFQFLLHQYAAIHFNKAHNNNLDIEENYDADTGQPIVGLGRSHHYLHSGFVDQIITGLVGIRPREDDVLEVNPLADPVTVPYFSIENVLYHGRNISVQWDRNGQRYGQAGLRISVDGALAASSDVLERHIIDLEPATVPVNRPISVSIQLQANVDSPTVSSSVQGANINRVHDAFDGRIWFWTEESIANGFDTPAGSDAEQWVSIDLGQGNTPESSRGEFAFYANEAQGFDAPASYRVQVLADGSWTNVPGAEYDDALANGISHGTWPTVSSQAWRLVVTPQPGKRVRVVEVSIIAA